MKNENRGEKKRKTNENKKKAKISQTDFEKKCIENQWFSEFR